MAKILDQEEQQRALKNINDSIRDLKKGIEFLKANNPTGTYTITMVDGDGKKRSTDIKATSEEINRLILSHREAEKTRIESLAKDNRIDLEESDIETLSFVPNGSEASEENTENTYPESADLGSEEA